MSLQIKGLHRVFDSAQGRGHVLRGIDLTVEPGEFVAVIGHSGCGKSTLLNLIAGLDRATAGTITLDDELVGGPGPDRAVVFQNFSLLPRQALIDNVRTAVREVDGNGQRPRSMPMSSATCARSGSGSTGTRSPGRSRAA